jgi:hypothetical protein
MTPLYIAADNTVKFEGAHDPDVSPTVYLNAGTCTWELMDADDAPFAPPRTGTLAHVAASDGNYLGQIDAAAVDDLTEEAEYHVWITFTEGNYSDLRRLKRWACYREEA